MTPLMLRIIGAVITLALAVPAFWLVMRYNMHMFQLNVYMTGEQNAWIKKNYRLQWILVFAMITGAAGVAAAALGIMWLEIVMTVTGWLTLAVIILVYRIMKQMSQKKKLVFTTRVKRMIITIIILCVLILALAVIVPGPGAVSGVLVFLTGAQLRMNIIANIINKPVEKFVKNYYINDAKKILRSNEDITIIGVTGSYGKTSVKFFLQTLLQQKYSVLATPESYNTPMGIVITIRKYMKPSHQIFICEMGARYVGEIKEICDLFPPHHGVITSIGPQHLDTFGSLDNIRKTKFELADALPDGAMLFLNGDNRYIEEHLADNGGSYDALDKVFYYSEESGSGYNASDVRVSNLGTEFTVTAPDGETEKFSMKLIGAHNVINVMGAIAVANRLGIPLKELRIPVRRLRPVKHRMEMKDSGNVTIIDDAFNSNPVGSKAAVETLRLFEGMRILITPGMVELGEDEAEYNRKFGTYAADCCDRILLVGRKHTEPIRDGALSAGFPEKNLQVFDAVEDAVNYAYSIKGQEHKYILLENDLPDNY